MRSGIFGTAFLIILAVVAFIGWNASFVVPQTQQVLVVRFGQVVREITSPGLYLKLPIVDSAVYIEKRILEVTVPSGGAGGQGASALEVITADQQVDPNAAPPAADAPIVAPEQTKRLAVDAFARYRIEKPLLFYQTLQTEAAARGQLNTIINGSVRRVLGGARFSEIVRDRRSALMAEITRQVDAETERYGIQMVDVRLSRADLPSALSESVFASMQTFFTQQATQTRSLGEQRAAEIRANAERQATVIRAEAQQKADETRGRGEAKRAAVFAEAVGRDPEFYEFYRRMQAIERGLGGAQTRLVISPNSDFFRTLNDPASQPLPGTGAPAGQ
jgi:modulator of FtsH protease HflC